MKQTNLLPSRAALLTALCLYSLAAQAQDATWAPLTSDWNTGTNWSTGVVPIGTATFDASTIMSLMFSQAATSVGTLQFNAPSYTFTLPSQSLTITGGGIEATPANAPRFELAAGSLAFTNSSTAGPAMIHVFDLGPVDFFDTSTAGDATINAGVAGSNDSFKGGFVLFHGNSTAANATLTSFVGSNIEFHDASTAGTATIIAGNATIPAGADNNGFIFFNDTSSADHATITVNPRAELSFAPGFFTGGTSTAGDATITNNGSTNFFQGSRGGNATITTNAGGVTNFFGVSTGENAAFITNAGGIVDISGLGTFPDTGQPPVDVPGMTAGSIAGDGTYKLGSKELTVGSNNMDTTVSGLIEDGGQAGGSGGSLIKVGIGTLTLLGDNTYSGGTTIEAGTLVAGTLNAALGISNALGTGSVFLGPGTLRTTSSSTGVPLRINVGGNYTQAVGGTLALGVAGINGEDYDHVQVGGNASLGGTLAVSSLNGFHPANGNLFEVLRSIGTRSGEFAHVNDFLNNNPNLQRVDIYASNGAALLYIATGPVPSPTPPSPTPPPPTPPPPTPPPPTPPPPTPPPPTPPPPTSPTPNPKPPIIVEIPEPLPPVNPEKPLLDGFLLAALNPTVEQLTSMFEIPFSGANTQRFNLNDRMTQIQRGSTGFVSPISPAPPPAPTGKDIGKKEVAPVFAPGPQNRWGVWVNGWGDWVSVDNDNSIKGYDFTTGGGSVGIDYRITDCLAVGMFGTYAHTWTSLNPGDVDVNTGRGGLYATYWNQGFYANGGIYGGSNSYDTSRQTLLQGQFANGSTSGYEFGSFVDTGYDFHFGNLSFGPIFSAQYTNVHIDSYTERSSFLALNIHSDSEESWRTDLGIQASYAWHVGQITVIPSLRATWEHEYKYSSLPITFGAAAFPGASATVFGPDEGHDSAIINAGAGVQWTPRISTYVGYQGQLGRGNYQANGVTGTISYSF